ncbi:MAG TPA: hypothetical protein VKE24_15775 [Candidatus Acidoferrales bacterium]|nr:hypothetical protein [Candidatus Acidoferrales bacterium]
MVSEHNQKWSAFLVRITVRGSGWFALAYLGYWLALALDRIVVQAVAYPLMGMPVTDWSVTPFRLRIANGIPAEWSSGLAPSAALPAILDVMLLVLLAACGLRLRSASLRTVCHFAGLWAVLLLTTEGATLAYWGRVRLAQYNVQIARLSADQLIVRSGVAALAALVVLAGGRMCSRRLVAELQRSILPREGWTWLALTLMILPVLLVLAGTFGFVLRFVGPRAFFYLLVPAGFCLLLALLGLLRQRKAPTATQFPALSSGQAFGALCTSVALGAALAEAPRVPSWLTERNLRRFSSSHHQVLYDPGAFSADFIRQFAQERERILAAETRRLNLSPNPSGTGRASPIHLRIVLYPDLSSFRKATGIERTYGVEGTTIRAVLGGYIKEVDPAADAAALLNAAWGRAGSPRMGDWAAEWLAGEWHGRTVDDCAAQIEREQGHYLLAQLVANNSDAFLSPLVRTPLGAAWMGTVVRRSGLEAVHKLYSAKLSEPNTASLAALLDTRPADLEQEWHDWAVRVALAPEADPVPRRSLDPNFFFRGISFSHEGWGGRGGGYVSPEAAAELRRLKALGANAIAVVPYGFSRSTNEESISYTDSDETDEDLTQALYVAHGLGMKVMLKPQLWVLRGGYTGTLHFEDPAARGAWMRNYREFILHYARLAELERFDLLSIGTELEGLTPYQEEWRRLIADVRRVYHGPLTYAANWGREFESLGFWDALDYMGINDYYPLAAGPTTLVEELLPGAEKLAAKFEAMSLRWQKPILFTEVGYPSRRGGSSEPWVEDNGRPVSLEEQAAAYEATFRAFAGKPWLRGMFWWKWPSSGRGGGPLEVSYTPLRKPATEVVRAWFTRLAASTQQTPAPVRVR